MNVHRSFTAIGTVAAATITAAVAYNALPPAHVFAATTYTGQATDYLNVRSAPATTATRLGLLAPGSAVEVIGNVDGRWLKINYHNQTAYVDGTYITEKAQPIGATAGTVQDVQPFSGTTTANLNVRFLPSTSGTLLTTLKAGSTVTVNGKTNDGWLRISYKSGIAYVAADYVTQSPAAASASTANVSAVQYTGTTTGNLNVRQSASTSSNILATLKQGAIVSVTGTSGDWLEIAYNGGTAWVSSKYVMQQNTAAAASASTANVSAVQYTGTTTGNLNVRQSASTSSNILATLKQGAIVSVTGTSGDWLEIAYNGGTAWVSSKYVDQSPASPVPGGSDVNAVQYTGTTTGNLNVRQSANTSAKILTTLGQGTSVSVVGTSGDWLQITYNGGTAWVYSAYVSKASPSTDSASTNMTSTGSAGTSTSTSATTNDSSSTNTSATSSTATPSTTQQMKYVIAASCNFRQGPDTSATIYNVLPTGTVVEWLADGPDGWEKISYGGKDGYVYGQYLDKEAQTTVTSGNQANITTQYNVSFAAALAAEQKVDSSSQLAAYLNPTNVQAGTSAYFQFLKLSSLSNISLSSMTSILSGRGILSNDAQTFITAADKYGINEIYLVAHALLETGNGTSQLANGVSYNGTTVYNMFGIGAYDGSAVASGAAYAYNQGWTTPEKAILGGAAWIAENYIYNSSYQQDTLYKMRWNPQALITGSAAHQYATDVAWAVNQTPMISAMYGLVSGANLVFDVPQYAN
ncbi:MAG: SH3 domain-containing protein [Sporolactobacillus sp.]